MTIFWKSFFFPSVNLDQFFYFLVENEFFFYQKFEKETCEHRKFFFPGCTCILNGQRAIREKNMWHFLQFLLLALKTLGLFTISPRVPFWHTILSVDWFILSAKHTSQAFLLGNFVMQPKWQSFIGSCSQKLTKNGIWKVFF